MEPIMGYSSHVMMRTFNASNFHDSRGMRMKNGRNTMSPTSQNGMERIYSGSRLSDRKPKKFFKETWATKLGFGISERDQNAIIDAKLEEIEYKMESHKTKK